MMTDAELLRSYAETRAEDAFSELVRRHLNMVYGVALRRTGGNASLAEEVTQNVFADLARKAATVSRHQALEGWLYTSTRLASALAVRTEVRRQTREEKAQLMQDDPSPPERDLDWQRLQPQLDDVLDDLGEADRKAVILRFYAAKPYAEIATALNLSEDAARRRVDRALDKLRLLLSRQGITSTSTAVSLALTGNATVVAPAGLAAGISQSILTVTAGGSALLLFMSSITLKTGVVTAVIVAGASGLLWQHHRAEASLASARLVQQSLATKLSAVEEELRRERTRGAEADEDVGKLITLIQETQTPPDRPIIAAPAAILTQAQVQARYRQAGELARNGDYATALQEYLWCYDEGMVRVGSFSGVRSSFLVSAIAELGNNYPPALEALKNRREAAERRMQEDPTDPGSAGDFASLNRVLKESHRTLAYFDALPADDPRRGGLGRHVFDQLATSRRYSEAAATTNYTNMARMLDMTWPLMAQRESLTAEQKARSITSLVTTTAKNIEVLAGAGDLANARALIGKILALDDSMNTRTILRDHLIRAGHPDLLN